MCASDLQRQAFWLLYGVSDSSIAPYYRGRKFRLPESHFLLLVSGISGLSSLHKGGFPVMAETTRKLAASTP